MNSHKLARSTKVNHLKHGSYRDLRTYPRPGHQDARDPSAGRANARPAGARGGAAPRFPASCERTRVLTLQGSEKPVLPLLGGKTVRRERPTFGEYAWSTFGERHGQDRPALWARRPRVFGPYESMLWPGSCSERPPPVHLQGEASSPGPAAWIRLGISERAVPQFPDAPSATLRPGRPRRGIIRPAGRGGRRGGQGIPRRGPHRSKRGPSG